MDFQKLANINLIKGAGGGDPRKGLCIMEMVSYFDGAELVTDRPECACPMLTDIAIEINDRAPSLAARNTLKPLLPLLSGSRDEGARKARAWFIMREIAVRILAERLDKIGGKAARLAIDIRTARSPQMMNAAVKRAGEELAIANANANAIANAIAIAIAYAAANAFAFANATATAATATTAATTTAAAYAYANANANAYANAYAIAYAIAADNLWLFDTMREILTEAIMLGAHGALDLDAPETDALADRLLDSLRRVEAQET